MNASDIRFVRDLRAVADELWRDGKGWILLAVATGWFLSIGVRYTYPSLLPFFRAEFGFGLTAAGLLLSALWFAYAIGQFPGGVLGDRIGEGNILVISTAISTVAVLAVAVSMNPWMLFFGTVLFGIATSLYGPTRFTIFTDIYPDRAGTAVGLSHASGSVGNTVLPAVAAVIATYTTWRAGYGLLIPVFAVVTVALWRLVPSRTSSGRQSDGDGPGYLLRRIGSSVTRGGIPLVVAIQVLLGFISQGFLGFYPTYLVEVKGFSPQIAALVFGAYFAIGVVIQPLTGLGKDRFGSRTTLTVIIGLYFIGLLALHFAQTLLHVLLVTALVSHRNGTGVVANTFLADALYDDIKGSGLGFLRTGWMLIGATSPIFVGYVGDLGLMRYAFLLLAALAGVATLLAVFVPAR